MDRRKFLGVGATALLASEIKGINIFESATNKIPESRIYASETNTNNADGLAVRFLGTGAADWNGRDERGELRRLSSALFDRKVLIDFTPSDIDMIPDGCRPDTIFYTHSHGDHYNPKAALKIGIKKVYLGNTWSNEAKEEFAKAASETKSEIPEIIPLEIGDKITVGELTFTVLPANHATGRAAEQTLMYLIEKGDIRVMYATDTGGIPAKAARLAGIDAHQSDGKPITGLIMEATMGLGFEDDFRIYSHSSVETVSQIVRVLIKTKRYNPPAGQPVYLTHMARTMHGTQAELDKTLPEPLRAAYDGLEVVFGKPTNR